MSKQDDIQAILDSFENTKLAKYSDNKLDAFNKQSILMKGHRNLKARKVKTPVGVFRSALEAANHYKVTHISVRDWCNCEGKEFYILPVNSKAKITNNPKSIISKKDKWDQYIEFYNEQGKILTRNEFSVLLAKEYKISGNALTYILNELTYKLGVVFRKSSRKTVVTPLGTFSPVKQAIIAHGKKKNNTQWLAKQIKNDPDSYYYVNDKGEKI